MQYAIIAAKSPMPENGKKFSLTQPDVEMPALIKLLQLIAGLNHLSKNNHYIALVKTFIQ